MDHLRFLIFNEAVCYFPHKPSVAVANRYNICQNNVPIVKTGIRLYRNFDSEHIFDTRYICYKDYKLKVHKAMRAHIADFKHESTSLY